MIDEITRTTPIGFYNYGVSYLDTARAALESGTSIRFSGPLEFLCAHGLELIFKADLIRTQSLDDVRKQYGHSLTELFSACSDTLKNHFQMDDAFEEIVEFLAYGHSQKPFENRYLRTGFRSIIEPAVILHHLNKLTTDDRQWLLRHFGDAI